MFDSLVELLLPRACLGCALAQSNWCLSCIAAELSPVLHRPDPCPPALPRVCAAASYSGSVRSAILAAKERDRRELDRPLGYLLATAVALTLTTASEPSIATESTDCPAVVWLIPIPASPAAIRARGRDHLSDWTRWAVRALVTENIRAQLVPALLRRRGGVDSVGLTAGQRSDNLTGAFVLRPMPAPPPATRIILVDDVVTTGATLVAASTRLMTDWDLAQADIGAAVVGATQRVH